MPRASGIVTITWSCIENAAACGTSSGTDAVSTLINLAIDESVLIEVSVEVPESLDSVSFAPRIEFAAGVQGFIFGNGVVRTDAVSSAYIFATGFEGGSP